MGYLLPHASPFTVRTGMSGLLCQGISTVISKAGWRVLPQRTAQILKHGEGVLLKAFAQDMLMPPPSREGKEWMQPVFGACITTPRQDRRPGTLSPGCTKHCLRMFGSFPCTQ